MKKSYYLIIFIIGISLSSFGQQRPQYTQYIFNNYLLNPALSGIENYTDFKAGYRKQWSGIEGAPQTTFAAAHWSLGGRLFMEKSFVYARKRK
ncbi:type IX secretion system membrane protein PorP/SprF [Pedobacter sp. UC225_61]|uniref:type IX secretion system membrane protein PorP/SprF n=1 Tax=Pedobacter sp. UC225_61 TaxID=3374623 RepID=UPI0037A68EC1